MHRNPRRLAGNAVTVVLLLLLVVGGALGVNYARNLQTDQQEEKTKRPYARYKLADLEILAQGYREEVAAAEKRAAGNRVETRQRHHFSDQVDEFERVQKAAHQARDKARDAAQTRRELQVIEAEMNRRGSSEGIMLHLERMLRL